MKKPTMNPMTNRISKRKRLLNTFWCWFCNAGFYSLLFFGTVKGVAGLLNVFALFLLLDVLATFIQVWLEDASKLRFSRSLTRYLDTPRTTLAEKLIVASVLVYYGHFVFGAIAVISGLMDSMALTRGQKLTLKGDQ